MVYSCGVLNCGNGDCVHKLTDEKCPHCECFLVEVKTTGHKFCSNHERVCDYEIPVKQGEIMISKEQYQEACKANDDSQRIINQYLEEQREAFEKRMKENPIFTDDELNYAAFNTCPCGHGLAYPKNCSPNHYWDCSALLKGTHSTDVRHTAKLYFTSSKIKSEAQPSAYGATTRGIFKKPQE